LAGSSLRQKEGNNNNININKNDKNFVEKENRNENADTGILNHIVDIAADEPNDNKNIICNNFSSNRDLSFSKINEVHESTGYNFNLAGNAKNGKNIIN